MNIDNKNNNPKEEKVKPIYIVGGLYLGIFLGWGFSSIIKLGESDAEKAAEKYLASFESNHDLNKKIDSLIEEFTMKDGSYCLGDDFEEYLGISLDFDKKQRLNNIANKLDIVKHELDSKEKRYSGFEFWSRESSLKEANEIVTENIMDDNGFDYDISLSMEYGKNYGWVVADDYYQIFDGMLNEYVSSYEVLDSRSTNLGDNENEYENIINGVLKSCLCDIVLDKDSNNVKVVIPNEVKQLVKKK